MTRETRKQKEWAEEAAELLIEKCGITREALFGEYGAVHDLHKAIIEKVLQGEMAYHLGYPPRGKKPEGEENSRNGYI